MWKPSELSIWHDLLAFQFCLQFHVYSCLLLCSPYDIRIAEASLHEVLVATGKLSWFYFNLSCLIVSVDWKPSALTVMTFCLCSWHMMYNLSFNEFKLSFFLSFSHGFSCKLTNSDLEESVSFLRLQMQNLRHSCVFNQLNCMVADRGQMPCNRKIVGSTETV